MITITTVSSTCSVIPPQTQLQLHNFPLRTSISTSLPSINHSRSSQKPFCQGPLCSYTKENPPTLLYQASSASPSLRLNGSVPLLNAPSE